MCWSYFVLQVPLPLPPWSFYVQIKPAITLPRTLVFVCIAEVRVRFKFLYSYPRSNASMLEHGMPDIWEVTFSCPCVLRDSKATSQVSQSGKDRGMMHERGKHIQAIHNLKYRCSLSGCLPRCSSVDPSLSWLTKAGPLLSCPSEPHLSRTLHLPCTTQESIKKNTSHSWYCLKNMLCPLTAS